MAPDIKIRDFYDKFISDANDDIKACTEYLKETDNKLNIIRTAIISYNETIENVLNIKLNNYKEEWIDKKYNNGEALYKIVVKRLKLYPDNLDINRQILLKIIKYCGLLYNKYKYNNIIKSAKIRSNVKLSDYKKIVHEYYTEVHRQVLLGKGYRFIGGIGTFCINYWKIHDNVNKCKLMIDFAATIKKKKEIIEKGLKPYDEKEAEFYKKYNMPYDGVDYRVYKRQNYIYEIAMIRSSIFTPRTMEFKHSEYIFHKYRGMSYIEMANKLCSTFDDIVNLQVDLKVKVNILIYKDPTKYLNFLRNDSARKYKY